MQTGRVTVISDPMIRINCFSGVDRQQGYNIYLSDKDAHSLLDALRQVLEETKPDAKPRRECTECGLFGHAICPTDCTPPTLAHWSPRMPDPDAPDEPRTCETCVLMSNVCCVNDCHKGSRWEPRAKTTPHTCGSCRWRAAPCEDCNHYNMWAPRS